MHILLILNWATWFKIGPTMSSFPSKTCTPASGHFPCIAHFMVGFVHSSVLMHEYLTYYNSYPNCRNPLEKTTRISMQYFHNHYRLHHNLFVKQGCQPDIKCFNLECPKSYWSILLSFKRRYLHHTILQNLRAPPPSSSFHYHPTFRPLYHLFNYQ